MTGDVLFVQFGMKEAQGWGVLPSHWLAARHAQTLASGLFSLGTGLEIHPCCTPAVELSRLASSWNSYKMTLVSRGPFTGNVPQGT